MKVLFFGDIVGKIGRKAIKQVLPAWRKKYAPDFIIASGDNLAHGISVTKSTAAEMLEAGVQVMTNGDHAFDKEEASEVVEQYPNVIRPANFPPGLPGTGDFLAVDSGKSLLVVNLVGRVFLRQNFDCPFRKLDEILKKYSEEKPMAVLVDFHAEATSEKMAMGFYADGRVSAVLGTHTHIGTADAKILPKGTAFISDVGMVGAIDSVIGAEKEAVLEALLNQTKFRYEPVESGVCQINAVLLEIDEKTNKTNSIKRLDEEIFIE